ncbi:PDDEXK nuclease domain-containing protein [Chryseobacterium koreense]|uniref:50S ribosomal protein L31 n=1 Tax=Chryseobacterium koreense CCUG 49689 TaxID=1304281 RepID=A0A0J7J0U0_9FLAO|nr:PDDEXK nuclease domain-containing protein [Chryseobacterium koreense]KMQ72053.1 hypothetical protein ACM44_03265 [Chryseobacterium koreense CCUG 49689]MBB5332074.1 putative nuclease of restriction endonuclease-like (RecB) superfamily [Chryseobacterium koreense]
MLQTNNYQELIQQIGVLLSQGRQKAVQSVNTILVKTYWEIGRYIVEFEQNGSERAEYGSKLFERISKDLSHLYGKGFSRSNILYMRKLYLSFQKSETLSHILTWSHYFEILKADSDLEIGFYTKQCELERWSVRELKRQMKSLLFQRIALSKDKEGILELSKKGHQIGKPEDLIKDPFVLEFLNIPEHFQWHEDDLEEEIISKLQNFIMEMGKGFAFIGRQYRMSIGGKHFRLDLLFYHRILKCFVLIDLKKGEITHEDIGQINLYLNYFKKEEATEGDNEPVGIILGNHKNEILVEYATDSITNKILLSKYQLYLPKKEDFQNFLEDKLLK